MIAVSDHRLSLVIIEREKRSKEVFTSKTTRNQKKTWRRKPMIKMSFIDEVVRVMSSELESLMGHLNNIFGSDHLKNVIDIVRSTIAYSMAHCEGFGTPFADRGVCH